MLEPGLWQDLIALVVTLGLTGWLLSLVVIPERLSRSTRAELSLSLAIPATGLVAGPTLAIHRLNAWSFVLSLSALGALATWRCRHAPHTFRIVRFPHLRLGLSDLTRLFGCLAAASLAWFAVLQPQFLTRRSSGLPQGTTVWYYWRLVDLTFQNSGLPSSLPEWGQPRPFPVEYLLATIHAASAAALAGGTDLIFLEHYRYALVVLALFAAYTLWRRWLPAWWAWIAAVLMLTTVRGLDRFAVYRTETVGLLLVLWSGFLFDEALGRRSRRWGALAGVLLASTFHTHAEISLLAGPLWTGIALSRLLPYVRSREKAIRHLETPAVRGVDGTGAWSLLSAGTVCLATFAVLFLAISTLAGGGERLVKLVSLGEAETRSSRSSATIDPTWDLWAATYYPNLVGSRPALRPCSSLLKGVLVTKHYQRVNLKLPHIQALLLVGSLLLVLTLPRMPSSARRCLLTWAIYIIGLYVGSEAICSVYDTYVPQRAGGSRILPNVSYGLAGLLALFGWSMAIRLFAVLRGLLPTRRHFWSMRVLAGLSTMLISLALTFSFAFPAKNGARGENNGVSPVAYEALTWAKTGTSVDAIILVNAYTEGSVTAISGRTGWLDGRAPYLEGDEWRFKATQSLLSSRQYFLAPLDNRDELPGSVDYVLAVKGYVNVGGVPFKTDMEALQKAPNLQLLRTFGNGEALLFEVKQREANSRLAK